MREIHYDNVQEMLDDIETLALAIIGGLSTVSFRVDNNTDANKPYILIMNDEDYEELCQRKRR